MATEQTSREEGRPDGARVRDVMVAAGTVSFGAPLREAAGRLEQSAADALVVVHDDGLLAGLLTERELVLGAQAEAEGHPGHAGEYAAGGFVIAQPEEALETVLQRLAERHARRAVILQDGVPAGLISLLGPAPSSGDLAEHATGASRGDHALGNVAGHHAPGADDGA